MDSEKQCAACSDRRSRLLLLNRAFTGLSSLRAKLGREPIQSRAAASAHALTWSADSNGDALKLWAAYLGG